MNIAAGISKQRNSGVVGSGMDPHGAWTLMRL